MLSEISNGIFLIDAMPGGIPGLVASYLIKGERSALVDVGYPSCANTLLSELQLQQGSAPHVDFLIPTHVHLDHAGALGHLARAMPEARVLVNEHGSRHIIDPTKLTQSATNVFGTEAMHVYGTPIPVTKERVEAVREIYNLDLGAGKKLKIFWTPGHAWHHMSVLLENERFLITGDAVGLHYPDFDFPIPATPPPGFDQERYTTTLAEFMGMDLTQLLLPHFGPVQDNVTDFLELNLETVRRWTSEAFEAVTCERSLDHLYNAFLAEVANRSGQRRVEIPRHIARSIRLSAMGCLSYAKERIAKQ